MTFDKTLLDTLEQLAQSMSAPAALVRRLVREGLCTDGPSPAPTAFGEDVLQLRRALANPPAPPPPPEPIDPPTHCIDVTDGEVDLLRMAALLPLTHPDAQHLPHPVETRSENGTMVLDLTDQQLAAVDYVFRLYGVTTSVRFHNRLGRRLNYRDMQERSGGDPAEVRGYRRLR